MTRDREREAWLDDAQGPLPKRIRLRRPLEAAGFTSSATTSSRSSLSDLSSIDVAEVREKLQRVARQYEDTFRKIQEAKLPTMTDAEYSRRLVDIEANRRRQAWMALYRQDARPTPFPLRKGLVRVRGRGLRPVRPPQEARGQVVHSPADADH